MVQCFPTHAPRARRQCQHLRLSCGPHFACVHEPESLFSCPKGAKRRQCRHMPKAARRATKRSPFGPRSQVCSAASAPSAPANASATCAPAASGAAPRSSSLRLSCFHSFSRDPHRSAAWRTKCNPPQLPVNRQRTAARAVVRRSSTQELVQYAGAYPTSPCPVTPAYRYVPYLREG